MPELGFLRDIVVVFGTALAVAISSARISMPPLVGYLIAGALVGPFALGWISDPHNVEVLAELGVAFILFAIGLELPMARLKRLGVILVVGGGLQVSLTAGLVAIPLGFGGYPHPTIALFAFSGALSSTAIVLRLLQSRQELRAPHGSFATAVLIAQDLLIVPLLVLVPLLSGASTVTMSQAMSRFGYGLGAVAALFLVGRMALPWLLRRIVDTRASELLTIAALFLCLGGGLATQSLGFSLALGAFLAGVLVADSDYHHQIIADTGPIRDVLASFFFVTIGMLLDVRFVLDNAPLILALALAIICTKALLAGGIARLFGFPMRYAVLAGIALAQIGEFSLVLLRAGHNAAILDDWHFQLAIAVAVATMVATPALLATAARRLGEVADRGASAPGDGPANHVVVFGFGTNGQHLVRVLTEAGIPYMVVDTNPRRVRAAASAQVKILFGDCTRPEIQRSAGILRCRLAVFAVSDPEAARLGVRVARQLRPDLFIVARAKSMESIHGFREGGADSVVAEEFEASIEITIEVMRQLRIPGNIIRTQAALLRQGGYDLLRRSTATLGTGDALRSALAAGTGDTFLLQPGHPAIGSTLTGLRLRERSGASVIAILRADKVIPSPGAGDILEEGDILFLIGSHEQVDAAFAMLGGVQAETQRTSEASADKSSFDADGPLP